MPPTPGFPFEQHEMLLEQWLEVRREISRREAEAAGLLAQRAALYDADSNAQPSQREAIRRSMIAEYSAAGHVSRTMIEWAFVDAQILVDHLPDVHDALREGAITVAHVREIVRASGIVREAIADGRADATALRLFEAAALVIAEADSPGRTRSQVRQVAATLAQETVSSRHSRSAAERTVTIEPLEDGLALLRVVLPETLAHAIHDRLTQMARRIVQARGAEPSHGPATRQLAGHGATRLAGQPIGRHADHLLDCDATRDATCDLHDPADVSPYLLEADPVFDSDLALDDPVHDDLLRRHAEWVSGLITSGDTFTIDPDLLPNRGHLADSVPGPDRAPDPHRPAGPGLGQLAGATRDRRSGGDADAGDARTLDQIRTDLLTDLLLVAAPDSCHGTALENVQARIQVTVAATTLAGLDDRLAELDGHGPVHPDVARDLAAHSGGWTRLFLDPTGMVTETDSYSPTAQMRRFLRARDQHCRFPGCRMPAASADIDHNCDHAKGGPTSRDNLSHFCRGHHSLKHPDIDPRYRWNARSLPDGSIAWQSPLHRTYVDPPPRRVMFV